MVADMEKIGPSGAPVKSIIKNKTGPLGGSMGKEGQDASLPGINFAYRPLWEIFIKSMGIPRQPKTTNDARYATQIGSLWRVTNALAGSASITKGEDVSASFIFTLNNTGYIFSDVFEEMDMVTCYLKGPIGDFERVFTGYIQNIDDDDPMLQGGLLNFTCYDVTKRMKIFTISPGDKELYRKVSQFERVEDYLKYFAKKAGFDVNKEVKIEPMEEAEFYGGSVKDNTTITPEQVDGLAGADPNIDAMIDWLNDPEGMFAEIQSLERQGEGFNVDGPNVRDFLPKMQMFWALREIVDVGRPITAKDIPQTVDAISGADYTHIFHARTGYIDDAKKELKKMILNLRLKMGDKGINTKLELEKFIEDNIYKLVTGKTKKEQIEDVKVSELTYRDDMVYPVRKAAQGPVDVKDTKKKYEGFKSKDYMPCLDHLDITENPDELVLIPTKAITDDTLNGPEAYFLDEQIAKWVKIGIPYSFAIRMVCGPDTISASLSKDDPNYSTDQGAIDAMKEQQAGQTLSEFKDVLSGSEKTALQKQTGNSILKRTTGYLDAGDCMNEGWVAVACCYGKIVVYDMVVDLKGIGRRIIIQADRKTTSEQIKDSQAQKATEYYWNNPGDKEVKKLKDKEKKKKIKSAEDAYVKSQVDKWEKTSPIQTDTDSKKGSPLKGPVSMPEAYFFYSHLDKKPYPGGLRVGSKVVPGQPIAYIGHTGLSKGSACQLSFRWSPYGITGKFEDPSVLLSRTQSEGGTNLNFEDIEFSPYYMAQEWDNYISNKKFSENLDLPFYDEEVIWDRFAFVAAYGTYHFWADGDGNLIVRHPKYFAKPDYYIPKEMCQSSILHKSDQSMRTHVFVVGDVDWDWETQQTPFTADAMETGKCTIEDSNATVFAWSRGESPRDIANKFGIRKEIYTNKYLHNKRQCAKYAMYMFAEKNRNRFTADAQIILTPFLDILDRVYLETKNMMFTVVGVSHNFGIDTPCTTSLQMLAGIKPSEFAELQNWLQAMRSLTIVPTQDLLDGNAAKLEKKLNEQMPESIKRK